jgi:hypothetical protein
MWGCPGSTGDTDGGHDDLPGRGAEFAQPADDECRHRHERRGVLEHLAQPLEVLPSAGRFVAGCAPDVEAVEGDHQGNAEPPRQGQQRDGVRTEMCVDHRYRPAVRARGHFPNEQSAMKTLYLVTRSLDPERTGQTRWVVRCKPALKAFTITSADRMPTPQNRS